MGMTIVGGGNFANLISQVKGEVSASVLRSALGYAIDPAVKAARQLAPKGSKMHKVSKKYGGRMVAPGFLSRSITKKTSTAKNKQGASATMALKDAAFYGQFVGSGYTPRRKGDAKRTHDKYGKKSATGRAVAGRPFMRPAVEQNEQAMNDRFRDKLISNLKKKGLL
jgi:hypothetical protein